MGSILVSAKTAILTSNAANAAREPSTTATSASPGKHVASASVLQQVGLSQPAIKHVFALSRLYDLPFASFPVQPLKVEQLSFLQFVPVQAEPGVGVAGTGVAGAGVAGAGVAGEMQHSSLVQGVDLHTYRLFRCAVLKTIGAGQTEASQTLSSTQHSSCLHERPAHVFVMCVRTFG